MTNEPNTNVPPVEDETHEPHEFVPEPYMLPICDVGDCGLPPTAPVHKVSVSRRTSVPEPPAISERQCEADSCPFDMPRPHLIRHHPTYMEHCDWCNQNYDVFTRSIHCPHNVKPQPAAPAISELGAFWVQWFEDVGAHGTMDVIHATTKLVIAEREIAVRDRLEPIQRAIEACEPLWRDGARVVSAPDWDALVAMVKENHNGK